MNVLSATAKELHRIRFYGMDECYEVKGRQDIARYRRMVDKANKAITSELGNGFSLAHEDAKLYWHGVEVVSVGGEISLVWNGLQAKLPTFLADMKVKLESFKYFEFMAKFLEV